jgi:hypothetical protein
MAASASTQNDWYNGEYIDITAGTGIGEYALITDYVGATNIAEVNFTAVPDGTTVYQVLHNATEINNQAYGISVGAGCYDTLVDGNDCYAGGRQGGISDAGTNTVFGAGNRNWAGGYSVTPS